MDFIVIDFIIKMMEKGGMLMYPMIILCVFSFFLIIERWLFLTKIQNRNKKLTEEVLKKIEKNDINGAKESCNDENSSVAKVLLTGLEYFKHDENTIEKKMDEIILGEIPKLERYLPIIAVISSMMPMLGLLGTVAGMISLFDSIATKGTGDPNAFAGGISVALITTETGLIFALPIMFFHTILTYKVNRVIGEMEVEAKRLINYKIVEKELKNGKI